MMSEVAMVQMIISLLAGQHLLIKKGSTLWSLNNKRWYVAIAMLSEQ
ncbi:hypothetical protein ATG66_3466 [Vibrio sp. ES.051]|nr:hypothetical protein ATG66_3466 [Vibrio sp. ES.051]